MVENLDQHVSNVARNVCCRHQIGQLETFKITLVLVADNGKPIAAPSSHHCRAWDRSPMALRVPRYSDSELAQRRGDWVNILKRYVDPKQKTWCVPYYNSLTFYYFCALTPIRCSTFSTCLKPAALSRRMTPSTKLLPFFTTCGFPV